jgi:hypothetical protein
MDSKTQAAIAGGPATAYGDTHWVTQPRFETGDSRYAWLNSVRRWRRDCLHRARGAAADYDWALGSASFQIERRSKIGNQRPFA